MWRKPSPRTHPYFAFPMFTSVVFNILLENLGLMSYIYPNSKQCPDDCIYEYKQCRNGHQQYLVSIYWYGKSLQHYANRFSYKLIGRNFQLKCRNVVDNWLQENWLLTLICGVMDNICEAQLFGAMWDLDKQTFEMHMYCASITVQKRQ